MTDNVKSMDDAPSSSVREKIGETVDRAKAAVGETVGAARERLQQVGGEVGAKARSVATDVRQQTRERYGAARDSVRQGYDRAKKDMDQLSSDVNVYVRDNPGKAILIAGGAGFLLGFLLRGQRRRS